MEDEVKETQPAPGADETTNAEATASETVVIPPPTATAEEATPGITDETQNGPGPDAPLGRTNSAEELLPEKGPEADLSGPTTGKNEGYIPPATEEGERPDDISEEEAYANQLANRINESKFGLTKVSHKDYVKMLKFKLIDNETKQTLTGCQLVIDPNSGDNTYWDVTVKQATEG